MRLYDTNLLDLTSPGPETADVLVFPLPYEGTVSYGEGAAEGPQAIINASEQVELWDLELGLDLQEALRVHTFPPLPVFGPPSRVQRQIARAVEERARRYPGKFYLGLGGEHSVTVPLVQGLRAAGALSSCGVLQIDAHADLREAWEGTPYSHACVMRRLREDLKLPTVHVGVRAVGPESRSYLQERRVPIFPAPYQREQLPGILRALPERVFVTFDVDALDPSIMPATGTPVPGGLLWEDALELLRAVFREKEVVSMDVVELAPIPSLHAPDFLAAQLVAKCLAYQFRYTRRHAVVENSSAALRTRRAEQARS